MNHASQCSKIFGVFLFLVIAVVALSAQTLSTLHSFNGSDGSSPYAGLTASKGELTSSLYGTTSAGGTNRDGTVFKITTSGALTTVHNFNHVSIVDGSQPRGWLIQAADGNLYGTTTRGGSFNVGTIFTITTSGGTLKTLHDFDYSPDGALPYAGLVQAANGNFYGTTPNGGGGAGTFFKVSSSGQLTALYDFGANGAAPVAGLVQASNGNFYGTATMGGFYSCGTLFEITPIGAFTLLHTFTGTDGCFPQATLVQGADGNLYGTTSAGGAHQGHNAGTAFKISQDGTFTLLHVFDLTDGAGSLGALIQATDGNFYGTTYGGGAYSEGTVFKMTPTGTVTTLYSFCSQSHCPDGSNPVAGLLQGSDGNLYGTTYSGGVSNQGTVFKLSVGLEK
jgi:uncharacterized repeat protein (TIGR03803 family)